MRRLEEADYIALYSNRLYGTIPRLPQRYPVTTKYYELLFSGELGFELVSFATSYPNIFGVSLVDDTLTRPSLPTPPGGTVARPAPAAANDVADLDPLDAHPFHAKPLAPQGLHANPGKSGEQRSPRPLSPLCPRDFSRNPNFH